MAIAEKISLIQTYPHVKNAAHAEFESLVTKKLIYWVSETEQARLDELERNELKFQTFEELTEDVQQKISRCLDKRNEFLFCYEPEWTRREVETAHDLISRFEIPEDKILEIRMPWTIDGRWVDFRSEYRQKINAILLNASKQDIHVREAVLVWRRSDSHSFLRYAPESWIDAWEARKLLEEEAVISIETKWKLYAWIPYWDIVSIMEKGVKRRQLHKIMESWKVLVNGISYDKYDYPNLYEHDVVRYKNRAVAVTVAEDWSTVLVKVPGNEQD